MADIKPLLGRLGMSEYIDRFCDEGFDTWEVIMDITETDLDSLAVAPNHREWLMQEISEARTHLKLVQHHVRPQHCAGTSVSTHESPLKNKRSYRRHPKADIHGPKHPLSAYILFSNDIRKNLQHKQLSFTQMARQVGESWQLFGSAELSEWKLRAASARELYLQDLEEYKQTREYREYQQYLFDFRIKSSMSHPRPRRQSISQRAPKSIDADQNLSATRRHRPSHSNLPACPNLKTLHYITPEAKTCQTKPLATHSSKSAHFLLPEDPSGSTPRPLVDTFYITTVYSRFEPPVPLLLTLTPSAIGPTSSPSTSTSPNAPQQRVNTRDPHRSTATEAKATTLIASPRPLHHLLPVSGWGLRVAPGPVLESGPSSLSALASDSQQAQVQVHPYSYQFLPRRSYFETILQSHVDDLSQEVRGSY